LTAEIGTFPAYFVSQKGSFDTLTLLDEPWKLFPAELWTKVPEARFDVIEAGKALCYELSTACGMHVFRAVETVLRRYYTEATGGRAQPKIRNIAVYITWTTYTETSDAKGRESSTEVYVSGQIGASIPLSKVISFDVNAGVKVGEKWYKTHEERKVTDQGKQLSRTFVVTKLGRNCLLYSPGIVNKPVVNPVAVQNGYNLVLKDAAAPKQGPFWNAYDLTAAQTYLGYAQATDAMQAMIDDIGLDLARRSRGAYAAGP
jgi:hypothetical protein